MRVRELMTRQVSTASPETTLATAADTLYTKDCGVIPVVDHAGKLVGIATDRDMFIALGTRNKLPTEITLGEVMTKKVITCTPDDDIRETLDKMRHAKVRRLPVIDEEGDIAGILALDDIARCAAPAGMNGGLSENDVIAALKSFSEKIPSATTPRPRR